MTGIPPQVCVRGLFLAQPRLVDFLHVCHQVSEDQRREYVALQGKPFDADCVALELANRGAPYWAIVSQTGETIAIGGFTWIRKGVWQDWLLYAEGCWSEHWRGLSKICRRVIDTMMQDSHRIQCITLASRDSARSWYRILGYEYEATLKGFGCDGEDAVIYSRVN